jgi:signal transduction histidine kinase
LADGVALEKQGFKKDFVEGRTIDEILPAENAVGLKKMYDAALAGEHIQSVREFNDHYYEVSFMPFRNEAGEIIAGMALTRDITTQKKVEIELRHSRNNLQELVAERTIQLENKAKELHLKNEELEAFTHTVAHDIKSPLHGLVGYSELLLEYRNEVNMQTADIERKIVYLAKQTSNIVDELLMFSHLHYNDIETEPVDMLLAIHMASERLHYEREEKSVKIEMGDMFPVALGYQSWVEEVWVNYLSNAIKYGGDPTHIKIGSKKVGSRWRYWVCDNGRGLTRAEQKKLFVPFTRLDQLKARGNGLGLSIVHRIIDKLDGRVGVDSKVGEGSCFWFELPAFKRSSSS